MGVGALFSWVWMVSFIGEDVRCRRRLSDRPRDDDHLVRGV